MSQIDVSEVQAKITRFGMQICVGIPILLFIAALVIRARLNFLATPVASEATNKLLGYVFIAAAFADIAAAFIIKRRLITAQNLRARFDFTPISFAKQLSSAYIPIFALCVAPIVYGIVFYFLGGDLDTLVLIAVVCPAGFMILRPREEEIERLAAGIFQIPGEENS